MGATPSLPGSLERQIAAIFDNVRTSLPSLMAIGLGDTNGLPVAFSGPTADKEAATAMASLLVSAAQRAAQLLDLPRVRDLLVDAYGSTLIVHPLGDRFILMAILNEDADLGRARLLVQTCGDDLRVALENA